MFSLARALPSPTSAEGCSLFVRLVHRYYGAVRLLRSVHVRRSALRLLGPVSILDRTETLQRSPGSRACCFSACAGSQTTQGRLTTRDLTQPAVLPSPSEVEVGALIERFSKLNSPAHRYPCLRFDRHLAMPAARLGAKMDSLSPFL